MEERLFYRSSSGGVHNNKPEPPPPSKKKKIDFKEKKNNTINSLNEVEGFLNDFKHFRRYIHLYKFFK